MAPPDAWHLPTEQSEQERKVLALKREVTVLKSTKPIIIAGFGSPTEPVSHFDLIVPMLPPLTEMQVESRLAAILSKNPRASVVAKRSLYQIEAIHRYPVEHYLAAYASYEGKVRDFLRELHRDANEVRRVQPFDYFICNDSRITAERLRVELTIEAGQRTVSLSGEQREAPTLPTPPNPIRRTLDLDSMMHFPHVPNMQPDDPVTFNWLERPTSSSPTGILQCVEFRPRRVWQDQFYLGLGKQHLAEGRMTLEISASNLPEPIHLAATFRITEIASEWTEALLDYFLSHNVDDED